MRLTKLVKSFALCMCLVLALPSQQADARTSTIKGIDVSGDYNGVVDWESVAAQGYTYAMIRIAEGQAPDVDSQFEANYAGAKAAGLKVGVYHDCCIRTPEAAILEANYCLKLLNGRELDYPVAYDIEKDKNDGGTFAGGIENTTAIAKSYCDVISAAGYTPMIYSTASHLTKDFNWEKLNGIKIWVAHYGVDETTFKGTYDMWQYTDKGSVEGANTDMGYCDLNYSFLEAESITLAEDAITIGLGEATSLVADLSPVGCTDSIQWTSSDESIATVDENGAVTSLAKGSATITATTGSGETADAVITVKKAPKSISLSSKSKRLSVGTTHQIKPILPTGSASNQITFKSSNTSVASVSDSGKIKAKKAGTTIITVTTFNGKSTTLKVTVK